MRMTASDSIAPRRLYWRSVLPIALAALALHVLTAPRYGYFRDEFYILACGRHLDWGYVDHAPLIGLIARITSLTLGTSLYALRFATGCSAAAKAILTALIARELGGNRFAQILSALTVLFVPVYLVIDNQFSLNTWEPLFWMGTVLVVLVSGRTNRPKLLLWAGLLAGLGLENKHSTLFFLAALAVGLLLTPMRRLLREPYLYYALAIAFLVFLPNVIWQWFHHFPTLEFLHQVDVTHKNVELPPARFVFAQLMMLSPVNAVLWLPGLYFLLRRAQYRFLGLTYLALLLTLMLLHGKDYYVAPIYPMLLAAGAVFWSTKARPVWVPIVLLFGGLLLYPLVLPLLPPDRIPGYMAAIGVAPGKTETAQTGLLPQYFGDQFGWPEIARAVAGTYRSLAPAEQAHTAIYTGSYGDAGALEFYGPALSLPRVLSAHNTYWYWGHGAEASTLILVNSERLIRDGRCTSVTDGPQVGHPFAMQMENFRIRVCHGLTQPLPELWPTLKHWQ